MGDCSSQFHAIYRTPLRLECVQNANDQAKNVSASIAGAPRPAATLPWFWSDQYDVKLQMAGVSTGYDQCVIRGRPEPGCSFSAWYLKEGKLIAVDAIDDTRAYVIGSKIIPRSAMPSPEFLADTRSELKELL